MLVADKDVDTEATEDPRRSGAAVKALDAVEEVPKPPESC